MIETSKDARRVAMDYLTHYQLTPFITTGRPTNENRLGMWRVPLLYLDEEIGHLGINYFSGEILAGYSTPIRKLRSKITDE